MFRTLLAVAIFQGGIGIAAARPPKALPPAPRITAQIAEVDWYEDYAKAMKAAKSQQKMLLVWFQPRQPNSISRQFESVSLRSPKMQILVERDVALKIPVDYRITVDGRETVVAAHPAFNELKGQAGIAILDFAHPDADQYGQVVTALPFSCGF